MERVASVREEIVRRLSSAATSQTATPTQHGDESFRRQETLPQLVLQTTPTPDNSINPGLKKNDIERRRQHRRRKQIVLQER
mmetsp:Transcript_29646/g.71732  ORF Transcript_29646/g.71732 Transcript_29646/m.71732 type:complete len:82 (+) Transcript_29646:1319-1564(+)